MYVIGIFIATSLIIFGVYKQSYSNPGNNETITPTIVQPQAGATPSNTPEITITPTPSLKPIRDTISPTPRSSPQPEKETNQSDTWNYPGSTVQSKTQSELTLISSDTPEVISAWYKTKIQDNGYSTKSFVQTKTNGQVLIVLSAAHDNRKVSITISQTENGLMSKVSITF